MTMSTALKTTDNITKLSKREPIYCNLNEDEFDLDSQLELLRLAASKIDTQPTVSANSSNNHFVQKRTMPSMTSVECFITDQPSTNYFISATPNVTKYQRRQTLLPQISHSDHDRHSDLSFSSDYKSNTFRSNCSSHESESIYVNIPPINVRRQTMGVIASKVPSSVTSKSDKDDFDFKKPVKNYGRIKSWAQSFDNLLKDQIGVMIFTKFLSSEFCDENIHFWLDVEKFKKLTSKPEIKKESKFIYDKYLAANAPMCININSQVRQTVSKSIRVPTKDIFDQAQSQIYTLMESDCYKRFIKSDLYQKCLESETTGKPLPFCSKEECNKKIVQKKKRRSLATFIFGRK